MRHLKKYNQFNDSINEEFFDVLWQSAKGAFKNFLTGLAAPFKSLKDDFKKGLKREELKKKLTTMLDSLLKTTSDSINKAEDESVINKIMDQFRKEFDEKCVEIDKEVDGKWLVYRSEDNKVLKSINYSPANLVDILN